MFKMKLKETTIRKILLAIIPGLIVSCFVYASNIYYDLDLGKIVSEEAQRISNEFDVTSTTTLATVSGYVGIGTSNPQYTLDVSGNFRITGTSTLATTTISKLNLAANLTGFLRVDNGVISTTTVTDGTVTSVDMTVPTGLAISGNPITATGTLALTYDTGYEGVKTASTTQWQTAFNWGNHATVGYLTTVAYTDLTGNPSDVLTAGTGLSWSTDTLNWSSTGLSWVGNSISDAYLDDDLTISGGSINNSPVGATTPSTGVFTNTTSTNNTVTGSSTLATTTASNLTVNGNTIITGSLGLTGTRIVKGWFTDLEVTNNIVGSITGNAATVTTNANLTGPITSVGNATAIASQTGTGTTFVMNTSPTLVTPVLGVASATSIDFGGTTLLSSRDLTIDTGGAFNISLSSAAGDDFTVDTDKFVVEGDTGYVGIGTTTPNALLDIGGGSQISAAFEMGILLKQNSTKITGLQFENTNSAGQSRFIAIADNDEYGIFTVPGTTVEGDWFGVNKNDGVFLISNSYRAMGIGTEKSYDLTFGTNDIARVTIKNDGKVGIGTTTPTSKLSVNGAITITADYDVLQPTSIFRQSSGDKLVFAGGTTGFQFNNTANSAPLVNILNTGSVGIGTTAPTSKLYVNDNTTSVWAAIINQNSATGYGLLVDGNATNSDPIFKVSNDGTNSLLRVQGNGYVGIGEGSPSQELSIVGDIQLEETTSDDTGVIYKGANRFIHNYTAPGANGKNTFIGINAGNFTMVTSGTDTNASYNTGVGYESLDSLTTGYSNSALGYSSLTANTTGYRNSAIGNNSLQSNTTGYNNSTLGYHSLYYNQEGNNNVAFGYRAGYGVSASNYSNNVFIGYQAGNSVTTGSNNIIIGYDEDMPTGATSNHLNIGGVIYGDTSIGKIGIGTSTPGAKLHLYEGASGGSQSGYAELVVEDNDYAGINILSPSSKTGFITFGDESDNDVGFIEYVHSSDYMKFNINAGERMRINSSGYVGIAMTNPSVALDVTGSIEYTGTITDVSDLRAKENIEAIEGSQALSILLQSQAKSFNMLDRPDRREYGYIAQEIQEIFPDAVSVIDPDTGYFGLNYMSFIPLATESIKELNRMIEELSSLSATTTEGGTIQTIDVRQELSSLGLVISDTGVLEIKELKVGSEEKPAGITLFDISTGQPYCLYIEDGNITKKDGECSFETQQASVIETIVEPDPIIEEPIEEENSTTTEETSTTTEEVIVEEETEEQEEVIEEETEESTEEEIIIPEVGDNTTTTEEIIEETETPVEEDPIEELTEEETPEPEIQEEVVEETLGEEVVEEPEQQLEEEPLDNN
jgi:hypothetical protein